jgi:hypothetical protein
MRDTTGEVVMSHDELRTTLAAWRDAERERRATTPGSAERIEAEGAVRRARLAFDAAVARDQEPTADSGRDASLLEASVTQAPVGFASLSLRDLERGPPPAPAPGLTRGR